MFAQHAVYAFLLHTLKRKYKTNPQVIYDTGAKSINYMCL